eukprot:gnl/MRDRNA2_/MRDRNA2_58720_c0_seq1.p1 gnl/MRDRNA2_/MRDRNA2_58720_c0~~gnl/MRDRNA2_/MRDRNA2_58720_c0_seq1.p1  ORF type:complete len:825 (+),score=166.93 gnl/MRDRNA2_/MRDRNA2_58720_c0_seq1:71-2476(+)
MGPPANANPDNVADRLPQPYRFVAKVLDDVLEKIGEQIDGIERKRRSEEYEFTLLQVPALSSQNIVGKVTCMNAAARGFSKIALGTNQGQVILLDCKDRRVAAQKYPFGEEVIQHVALSTGTSYRFHATSDPQEIGLRPWPKLAVASAKAASVLVYNITKESYGTTLRPLCTVKAPEMVVDEESTTAPPPPVTQLSALGCMGGLWIIVLQPDRKFRMYLCPAGPCEARSHDKEGTLLDKTIHEDEEDAGQTAQESEFENIEVVQTPFYQVELPGMSPLPGLPEPPIEYILTSAFNIRPTKRGPLPQPIPSAFLVASTESNSFYHYSIKVPDPPKAVSTDIDVLLKEQEPPLGTLKQPEEGETQTLVPQRRWMLPAKTTVIAESTNGGVFTVGGVDGSIAFFNTAAGPSLKTMLQGHYGAVSAMSFHAADVLITVGKDSWIHHYSVQTQTLTFRCLLSPPPEPPPAIKVVAAPGAAMALALDEKGNMRLMDLRLGRKLAKLSCVEADPNDPNQEQELIPDRIIPSAHGFCVLCKNLSGMDMDSQEPDHEDVYFFDHKTTLCRLFPGIEARLSSGEDADAEHLFETLTPDQMASAPDTGMGGGPDGDGSPMSPGAHSGMAHRKRSTFVGGMGASGKRTTRTSVASLNRQKSVTGDSLSNTQKTDDEGSSQNASERRRTSGMQPAGAGTRVSLVEAPSLILPQNQAEQSFDSQADQVTSARLTAANLQQHTSKKAGGDGHISPGGAGERDEDGHEAPEEVLRSIPDNWQVSVHTYLKRGLGDKAGRQARITRRMEYLRKELDAA